MPRLRAPRLRSSLLAWYRRKRRDLPWRRSADPYRVWVSEIMLQQTTVATVIPYYERFLRKFPDIGSLARAREREVLRAWAGLGYYSRARNLHTAAKKVLSTHGGVFPKTFEDLIALPGIGRYTAGAVLSIALGKPAALVDGNVMRVFARLFSINKDIKTAAAQKEFWSLAESLVPVKKPGDWNQALMELGATICLPESPTCGACPVSGDCLAFRKGLQDRLPVAGKRPDFIDLKWTCLWIEDGGKVLLWKRSDTERFLKGHWGLPEARHLKAALGPKLRSVRHNITHHRIAMDIRRATPKGPLPPSGRWVAKARVPEFLVSSLWLKSLPQRPN